MSLTGYQNAFRTHMTNAYAFPYLLEKTVLEFFG